MGREWCWDHPFFAGTYALHCVLCTLNLLASRVQFTACHKHKNLIRFKRNHIIVSHYFVSLYISLSLHFNFPPSKTNNLNFDSYRFITQFWFRRKEAFETYPTWPWCMVVDQLHSHLKSSPFTPLLNGMSILMPWSKLTNWFVLELSFG